MIWHHFIIGEYKNFEDGMQQILRLECERGDLSWLHLVGKKSYSSEKCNLLVPTPGEKQRFDVEYNRAGTAGWKIEYNNNSIGVSAAHGTFTLLDGENLSLGMNV
ncbi:2464_t:CDS:2 [Gigaspora margarita]|uniref:2464_t:CDS:1 n=1 Tax=Gigaspora margarita TaxID=4874 RepID=A0ABM8W3B8_GIGMA|nr:2464_t:CDS:2 [Gigaspora margarita]